jgi:hypothetical protein
MKKHVIIATDTMLKKEKMNIIFHRRAAHASLNCRKSFTSCRSVPEPSTQDKCRYRTTAPGGTASPA